MISSPSNSGRVHGKKNALFLSFLMKNCAKGVFKRIQGIKKVRSITEGFIRLSWILQSFFLVLRICLKFYLPTLMLERKD